MAKDLMHFIGGAHVPGKSGRFLDVTNPNTGEVTARTPLASAAELRAAVDVAAKAFPGWAATNPQRRARVMFEFKRLLEANMDELAELLSAEHGKVIADSKGDVQRGLEVIEFACGIPHLMKGEFTEGAGPGIDMYSMRQPLGVCAGITPFNFPAMIPMWMFGVSIACGNTFIVKPSEKDPSVPIRLAERFHRKPVRRRASSTSSMATRKRSTRSSPTRRSRRSALSVLPTLRNMSMRQARRMESVCRRWAGRRTTPSSCRMPTWIRS